MSFFGLSVATQGLYTARGALDVTAHNISNAETDGYSRQQAVQQAARPIDNGTNIGMWGTGSEIIEVSRIRDEYFDYKYWDSNTLLGEYESKALHMGQIEIMFNEPSDSGFTTSFNNFFDSLQDLSKNPADPSYKAQTVGMASSFAAYFNTVATSMNEYQKDLNQEVKQLVGEINDIASQVAKLNDQIYTLELSGLKANDLRDQRDLLVDELSGIVPVDVSYIEDAHGYEEMVLKINGETLVHHNDYNTLEIVERDYKKNPEDADGLFDVNWSNGNPFDINHSNMSGELKAIIDVRDGNNGANFNGGVKQYDETTGEMVIEGINRFDILPSGEIEIDGVAYKYTVSSYNDTDNEMTIILTDKPPAADITIGGDAEIGESLTCKGIPYYMQKLNEFVRTFAEEFNQIHMQGQLEDGSYAQEFFVTEDINNGGGSSMDLNDPYSYTQITAQNFAVSSEIEEDHTKFATSYSVTNGESDNQLILDLSGIKDGSAFSNSDPANYMEMLIADVGIDTMKANTFYSNQNSINHTIENQRLSFLSVDLNEESMNMVKYQQAYNVAAKMISVFDEICDTTINGLIR
ncbi:flagellar hook-associated protein FlgK [Vallitalea okinawensis]|uniref:flagellar hook-associated protein FlgK n=1 Tax=Vallitalea okinawensis TaxID=2078660 RepID=UPI001300695F|nr:flagellar hook-associated protein FlgK [Vallitalea okinawensis]